MNFDERDSHWESFLQGKANLSQSFQKDSCCKVCLCLELLKLSTCKDSCYRPQEENHLINRLLQGILDPDTFAQITENLKEHLKNVNFISTFQEKISELEAISRKYSQKLAEINLSSQIPQKKPEKSVENSKLDILITRIEIYEDTLINLRQENEELRTHLKRVMCIYEDCLSSNRKAAADIRVEFEAIKEDQSRIRSGLDTLSKSISDNTSFLKDLKNLKDLKDDNESKAFRLQVSDEVKEFNEKTQTAVKKIQEAGLEAEKRIDEAWSQIQDLKKEHESILGWQKECKVVSRHSAHLLSASDSVYSAMNQFQDFNQYLESRLDNLSKEIEMRVGEKREEWTHVGNYKYDEEMQRFCWSCCKGMQDGRGCERR